MNTHQPHLTSSGSWIYDCPHRDHYHVWSVDRQRAEYAIQDHDRRYHSQTAEPVQGEGSA